MVRTQEGEAKGVESYARSKVSLPLFGVVGQLTIMLIFNKCFPVLMKSIYRHVDRKEKKREYRHVDRKQKKRL